MNWIEEQIYACMQPTADLYAKTEDPYHRAILRTWWRHVHLEGAAMLDEITADDMMADHPVYRVAWGANPVVIEGKKGVRAFYSSVGEAVLWHSDDAISVGDHGMADEITFHQVLSGAVAASLGYEVDDLEATYHISSRQAFIWPFDDRARVQGEHLYEDKTSLSIEKIDPADTITPARVREIHTELLAKLDAELGENYWVYTP